MSLQKMSICYLMLFVLFFVSYGYFFQGGGWNQNGRICLTRAIIERGTFTIDQYKENVPEMEFVNTGDWAFYNGHYYCNKSPGLSFLAVPSFALTQYFLKRILPDNPEQQVLFSAYVSNLCTTVLMSSLLCLLFFHVFYQLCNRGLRDSFLLTIFFGFGTLAFPYSTAFYCHQPAASCTFLSLVLAMHVRHGTSRRKQGIAFLAGLSAGLGVLIEPSCIYLLGAVLIYVGWFKKSRRYLPAFIAGCIPPGLIQGFYNVVCFGHPLASSYNYSNDAVMWKVNGRLFGAPNPKVLMQLLVSPYRGLFFTSPVLLMALPGIVFFLRKKGWCAEAILCLCSSIFFIIFIASFYAWHGGSAPGPRYLLPIFPFLFLIAGCSIIRFPKTFICTGIVSILINLSITIVGVEIPREIGNPLYDVVLKNILAGNVSINPVPFSHFNHYPNISEFAKVERWGSILNFNSFNIGELIFPYRLTSLVPLVVFWIIWGYFFWRNFIYTEKETHS